MARWIVAFVVICCVQLAVDSCKGGMRRYPITQNSYCADGSVRQYGTSGKIQYEGDGIAPNGTRLQNCKWTISEEHSSDTLALLLMAEKVNLPQNKNGCTGSLKFPGESHYYCDMENILPCRLYTTANSTCDENSLKEFVKGKYGSCEKPQIFLAGGSDYAINLKLLTSDEKNFTINFEIFNCTSLSEITTETQTNNSTTFDQMKGSMNQTTLIIAIIVPIIAVVLILCVAVGCIVQRRKKKCEDLRKVVIQVSLEDTHPEDGGREAQVYENDNHTVDETGYEVPRNMLQYENLKTGGQYENLKDDRQYEDIRNDQSGQSSMYTVI